MTVYTFNNLLIALSDERKVVALAVAIDQDLRVMVGPMGSRNKNRSADRECGTEAKYRAGCRCDACLAARRLADQARRGVTSPRGPYRRRAA